MVNGASAQLSLKSLTSLTSLACVRLANRTSSDTVRKSIFSILQRYEKILIYCRQINSDNIAERLKSALKSEMLDAKRSENTEQKQTEEAEEKNDKETEISTEKVESFYIVKAILRKCIGSERITFRDAKAYFSILIDDNNRKLACRLYLNSPTNKMIAFVGEDKKEVRHKIESINGIFDYAEQLTEIVDKYK